MLKAVWFQIHWFLGITAGLVLAVVGFTGGMLSFEGDILDALNPGIRTVTAQPAGPLAPDALLEKIRAAAPGRTITSLTVYADPESPARVMLAPAPGGAGGPRGEVRYVNPYSGALLGEPRGVEFFRTVMRIHRWLAADDVGKQIVGASTIALIVLSLSGLYLRWPRRWADWRTWLRLDLSRRGRTLFWELHSVIGTWVLPFYLLASFTGLYWSYDWYRDALFEITGAPRPQQMRAAGPPQGQQGQGQPGQRPQGEGRAAGGRDGAPRAAADLTTLWPVFLKESGGYTSASLRLQPAGGPTLSISYVPRNPAHERASNTLVLEASGAVREHRRYADLPVGQKIMASIFVLHAGSYFGLPGLVLMMVASLLMPLFAITGWLLYLDRRRKKAAAREAERAVSPVTATGRPLLLAFASQSGNAERLAWRSAAALQSGGVPVTVAPLASLTPANLAQAERALFVVSTFGEGEPPDAARAFARRLHTGSAPLGTLSYGMLALGDRAYADFCGFGHMLEGWLRRQGGTALFPMVEMDGEDPAALARWQAALARLAPAPLTWAGMGTEATFAPWTLKARTCLNPQSAGLPTFLLSLAPPPGVRPLWQAGDIVEIRPRHGNEAVEAVLARHGLTADMPVMVQGRQEALGAVLTRSVLPEGVVAGDAQALAGQLVPLPHRDYSIASLPSDGTLDLLVRQARTPEGALGLGSGFLTAHLADGGEVDARIRPNPTFAPPKDDRPMILIGNGTGLAGLRAHLKARVAAGQGRNWLLFGERNAASDFYFRNEITGWQESGALARVDLAFSRDQNSRVYVQDKLKAAGSELVSWVRDGAAIYVCGSLQGMAPAVEAVLADLIGAQALDALAAEQRYCRDVY